MVFVDGNSALDDFDKLTLALAEANPNRHHGSLHVEQTKRSFSLQSLLLVMTLISVWLAVTTQAPVWGVFAGIILVPALLRTVWIGLRKSQASDSLSPIEKIKTFAESSAIVAAIITVPIIVCSVVLSVGVFLSFLTVTAESEALGQAILLTTLFAACVFGLATFAFLTMQFWIPRK